MNQFIKSFNLIDKEIIKFSKKCLLFDFYFCVFATIFLLIYKFYSAPTLFIIGATLLKYGLIYCICTIVFSFAFSKIREDL